MSVTFLFMAFYLSSLLDNGHFALANLQVFDFTYLIPIHAHGMSRVHVNFFTPWNLNSIKYLSHPHRKNLLRLPLFRQNKN